MSEKEPLSNAGKVVPEVTAENMKSLMPDITNEDRLADLVSRLEEEQPAISEWLTGFCDDMKEKGKEEVADGILMSAIVVYFGIRSQIEKRNLPEV